MKVSIVVLNYRTACLAIQCVDSILCVCSGDWFEIIIIDNHSNNDSCELISGYIASCKVGHKISLIRNHVNGGFSSGNNVGIAQCDGKYVLLLNSDTVVLPGAIEALVKTLDDNPQLGIASPRLESTEGVPQESCFKYHRPISEIIQSAATGPVTRLLKAYEVPVKVTNEISYPEWTSFACVLIRRKIFDDVGLLDDGFFMYFEDVDFCRRSNDAGWYIVNNPEARVIHFGSGSSNVGIQIASQKRPPRYWYESRSRYYHKYYGHVGFLAANIFWYLGWLIAMTRRVLNRRYQPKICEKQWRDIWINFLNPKSAYVHPDRY